MNYNVGVIHISDNVGFLFEEFFISSKYISFSGHLSKFKTVIERNGILPHLFVIVSPYVITSNHYSFMHF